ncbi:non-ribosomal peptide synthetase [Streptomyces sp. 5-10]|uniref:non-ribosomal peptide synthetase n=1 Tax=Streptomyces sp. 5-10 TaxID=878925 RepID=UPI00168BD59F|nr:non-ribosomal peptide synthetase [Streptomyces sp. 5-10]MBD3003664.1 amino acid adenylation domain-containing protein [Streptomyces sp. 5-10]
MSADTTESAVNTVERGPGLPFLGTAQDGPALRHPVTLSAARWRSIGERARAAGLEPVVVLRTAFTDVLALWSRGPRFSVRSRSAEGCLLVEVDALAEGSFLDRAAGSRGSERREDEAPAERPVPLVEFADHIGGAAAGPPTGPEALLTVRVEPGDGGITAQWRAPASVLPDGMVEDMATAWHELLVTLDESPAAWTDPGSPVRLPAAQRRAREEVNATAAPIPEGLLHEAVGRAAALHPDRVAVVCGNRRLRYAELMSRARRIGRRLRALGAVPGGLVAVCMEKGWEQPVGILGVLESGAGWVPVDPGLPAGRRGYILETTGTDVVLTQRAVAGRCDWPAGMTVLVVDDDEEWAGLDDEPLAPAQTPGDLAYVLFTSGSTGTPKGVMIPHRGALNTVLDVNARYGVTCEDRFIGLSAMSFDLSLWDMFGALCAGAALVLPEPGNERDPAHWVELVRRESITTWMGAPALFELFCEQVERSPEPWADSLRLLILGGDWIPLSLPERAKNIAPDVRFISLGGNTEASILSSTFDVERVDPAWTSIPYGMPLANQTLHVLDPALRPRPVGVPGELYIGGTGVALGYWRDPQRTAESFLVHPVTGERLYRTGDLARFLPDGNVEFLGREDFQVKVDGHRIELGEIEAVLRTHPAVDSAVVVALPRQDGELGNQALAGYVTPVVGGAGPEPDRLRAHLADRLPAFMVPAYLVAVETLPLTAHGKVDRRALPRPGAQGSDDGGRTAPRTSVESLVADLWSEVLGADRVGVHDSFFEMGGNSLLGIRVMNRLRERLGLKLDPHALFRHRTVAELSLAIDQERAQADRHGPDGGLPTVRTSPGSAHEPFGLTDQQEAYCVGRTGALSSGNVSAHMYLEFEGEGLDLDRFQRAWQRVVDRHPMMRAVVLPETMTQRVLESVPPYEMRVVDLRGADAEEVRTGLAEIRERYSHEVRPVDTWPLFDVVVARLDGARYRVHFSIDALCADFASARLLFDDLSRWYAEPEAQLSPPPMSYRDYVLTTADLSGTEHYQRSLAYWEKRLPTLPPAPALPMVCAPESVPNPRFVRRSLRLDAERWQRLVARSGAEELTPAGLLLAVYAEVLAPWAQSPQFTLNVTNLNRLPVHAEVDRTVGEFASFALVEVDAALGGGFGLRARRIQERLWSDLSHSYVSGVHLLRELMRLRGGFDGALMPVVFTSAVPLAGGTSTLLNGVLRQTDGITQTPQVWMDLLTEVQDGELVVNWDVAEALFAPDLLDEIFSGMGALLTRLADDEAAWSAEEPVRPAGRLTADGARFGDGGSRELPDRLVHDSFLEQVALRPSQPAVVAAGRTLSYAEVHREACRVAHWLREHGAGPGRPVAIVMDKGWEQIVAAYAVLYAGAPYLPIDPEVVAGRLRMLLDRCEVELVLTGRALREKIPDDRVSLCLDALPEDASPSDPPPPARSAEPSDLAYVLFTSGSSGQPKGVMIEHRGVLNALRATTEEFAIAPGDRALALTALHHDMSVFDVFGVLGAGGTLVVPDAGSRREPAQWARLLAKHEVTVWNSVPAMMEMLLEHLGPDTDPLASLRVAFLGGDWLPIPTVRRLLEQPGLEVVSVGGPTETTLWNIWHRVTRLDPERRSIPYGTPIANTRYHILDQRLRDRPVWATGEMYCSGVGLARGYWGDPERTAAAFTTHPRTGERLYRTGDLGRFLPDGTIEFVGRADFQVQVNGHRVEPGEVEAALLTHPAVASAVVTGQPRTGRLGHRGLTGYLVPVAGAAAGSDLSAQLRDHLRRTLPEYMVPSVFVTLDALPLNANGKVDRLALPVARPERAAAPSAPRSAVGELCADVWAEVLGLDAVGEQDNFFELGGDSVLATRIVARLREVFESDDVSLRTMFLSPTVAGTAEALVSAEEVPGRTEAMADIHLRVRRMSQEEVARELSARGAVLRGGVEA